MKTLYREKSLTCYNSSLQKPFQRPSSSFSKRSFKNFRKNSSTCDLPSTIIFTMPNNKKSIYGMGKNSS